jgi:ABC-2 type transport system permease protein
MTSFGRVSLNARVQLEELARYPAFVAPSLGLPLVSYLIFGLPHVHGDAGIAGRTLASFAAFAVLGIAMFQFGVGIASDRGTAWERWVRTLPSSAGERFAARTLVALLFSLAALVPLVVLAVLSTPVQLGAATWLRLLIALLAGSIPLGLLGIMLGYLLSERGALPVTNLLFLPMAWAGGLFGDDAVDLPSAVGRVSPWLPTRQWSDVVLGFGLHGSLPGHQVLALVGYGIAFAGLAVLGYRRDELRQYR